MNLEQAFNTYYQELVWFGNKIVDNRQAAEEIVADVFVALQKPQMEGLRFYLYRAVKNRCINYLEWVKKRRTVELTGDEWVETTAMIHVDYLKKMHEAIQYLTPTEKEVVYLYIKGKEAKEIAGILKKEQATIRSIKRVAINKLRKMIL